jgi:hypothetical protein
VQVTAVIGHVASVTVLDGIGKAQLAAEFVHRYGQYFPGGVFWLGYAVLGWLPAPSSGIATCLNRAIDMTGLSPVGSQPCRLLRPRPPAGRRPRAGGAGRSCIVTRDRDSAGRCYVASGRFLMATRDRESALAGGRGRPEMDPAKTADAGLLHLATRRQRAPRQPTDSEQTRSSAAGEQLAHALGHDAHRGPLRGIRGRDQP